MTSERMKVLREIVEQSIAHDKRLLEDHRTLIRDLEDQLDALRHEHERLKEELSQRKGWQKCETHDEINADHAWGCPDCVAELRKEIGSTQHEGFYGRAAARLTTQRDSLSRQVKIAVEALEILSASLTARRALNEIEAIQKEGIR